MWDNIKLALAVIGTFIVFNLLYWYPSYAGTGAIFGGADILMLKPSIRFKDSNNRISTNVDDDPRVVPTAGIPGDMFVRPSSGNWFRKTDTGVTINWVLITDFTTSRIIDDWRVDTAYVTDEVTIVDEQLFTRAAIGYTSNSVDWLTDFIAGNTEWIAPPDLPNGIIEVPTVAINGGNIDLGAGKGIFADYAGFRLIPTITAIDWIAQSCAIPDPTGWNTVSVDTLGIIQCAAGGPTSALYYSDIVIATIQPQLGSVSSAGVYPTNALQQFVDNLNFLGPVFDGGAFSGNVDLTFNRAAVELQHTGANNQAVKPNIIDIAAESPVNFFYADATGIRAGGVQTDIDTLQYDPDQNGILVTLTPNRWSWQRFYTALDGRIVVLYGQFQYQTEDEARSGFITDSLNVAVDPDWDNTLGWVGGVIYTRGETQLDGLGLDNVLFISCEGQGCGSTGSGGSASGAGGDFFGPASSLDGNLVSFSGLTGKVGQDSGIPSEDVITQFEPLNVIPLDTLTNPDTWAVYADGTGRILREGTVVFGDFELLLPAPLFTEGRLFYDDTTKSLSYFTDQTDVKMDIGQELWARVRNDTGVQIDNGAVVYITGAVGGVPTIALALADDRTTAAALGVATQDIADNTEGFVTTSGIVRDFDTSAFLDGDKVYLSDTVAGALTNLAPAITTQVGTILFADLTAGTLSVIIESGEDQIPANWDGNLLSNNGFEQGIDTGWVFTAGTVVETTVDPLIELTSATFDPQSQGNFIESDPYLVPLGLRSNTCKAEVRWQGGDDQITVEVADANNDVLIAEDLVNVSVTTTRILIFECPSDADISGDANKGLLRLRLFQKSFQIAIAARLDEMYLGEFGVVSVSTGTDGPVGEIVAMGVTVTPDNFLPADGAAISRTTFSDLFSAIGTAYGEGDGATTFNVPDIRGKFLRGQSGGTNNDPDRAARIACATGGATGDNLGSCQTDAFQGHWHDFNKNSSAGVNKLVNVLNSSTNNVPFSGTATGSADGSGGFLVVDPSADDRGNGAPRTSNESRPLNVYVRYFIRYTRSFSQAATIVPSTTTISLDVEEYRADTFNGPAGAGQGTMGFQNTTLNTLNDCGAVTTPTTALTYTGSKSCLVSISCSYQSDVNESAQTNLLLDGAVLAADASDIGSAAGTQTTTTVVVVGAGSTLTCDKATTSTATAGNFARITLTATNLDTEVTISTFTPVVTIEGTETIVEELRATGFQSPTTTTGTIVFQNTLKNTLSSCGSYNASTGEYTAGSAECTTTINCSYFADQTFIAAINIIINGAGRMPTQADPINGGTLEAAQTASYTYIPATGDVIGCFKFVSDQSSVGNLAEFKITTTLHGKPGLIDGGGGTGDVVGPASSVDNRNVLFNGASGKLIKQTDYTMPVADGSANDVLTTDGAGAVTFQPGATVTSTIGTAPIPAHIESCFVTNAGAPATASPACAGWVTGVALNGTGRVDFTITGAVFTNPPNCTVSIGDGSARCAVIIGPTTTTTVDTLVFDCATGTADNRNIYLMCHGN